MSMLAPEAMLETNLFVLEPDLEVVTNALARMEALHLEEAAPEGWAPSPEWTELSNRYGNLTLRLGEMHPGEWRLLTAREIATLKAAGPSTSP